MTGIHKDDAQLVSLIISGDRDAFGKVIKAYQDQLIRICMGYVGSREDAEDIAQEVFVETYRSAAKFRGDSSLKTWLFRIAINKSLNHIRDNRNKFRVYKSGRLAGEDTLNLSTTDESSDAGLVNSDHKKALHTAIGNLPEKQKTAFILNKYDDMTYHEIATVMNTTHSSVESLIFRAKQNLQKSLEIYFRKNM